MRSQGEDTRRIGVGQDSAALADAIEALGPSVQIAMVRRAGRPEEQVMFGTESVRSASPDYFTTILLKSTAP